jgi:antitoxin (DNA-binding transcriptional repressor) of toxin-antitoxin stability system
MPTVTIEEAQSRLPELIDQLLPGTELVITRDGKPVAQLKSLPTRKPTPRFGSAKGQLIIKDDVADDEHLKDFSEYM